MTNSKKDVYIIGVAGLATHGKSTVSQIIRAMCPKEKVEVIPFAKGVKDLASSLGWNGKKDENGRKILQYLGTEVCRRIDEDYWVKKFNANYVSAIQRGATVIICDDLRFENEYTFMFLKGAYFIKVKRKMSILGKLLYNIKNVLGLIHESEKCFNGKENIFDKVIENYGSMQDLERQVSDIILELGLRTQDELDSIEKEIKEADTDAKLEE